MSRHKKDLSTDAAKKIYGTSKHAEPKPKKDAVDRWADEGGAVPAEPVDRTKPAAKGRKTPAQARSGAGNR